MSSDLHGGYGIDAEGAWEIEQGYTNKVRVGVIDKGIDARHPELRPFLNFQTVNGVIQTTASGAEIVEGKNFAYGCDEDDTHDYSGHGTMMSSLICSAGANIWGVSRNVTLVPLVYGMEASEVIEAIFHAINIEIDILNFSSGYFKSGTDVLSASESYSGLFVCSAANDEIDIDPQTVFSSPNVLTVGAINTEGGIATEKDWERWKGSNWGATSVDIFAPGTDILSSTYYGFDLSVNIEEEACMYVAGTFGTSQAAAITTGVAALMLAAEPRLHAELIKEIIMESVVQDARLTNLCVSGGRLNAANALAKVAEIQEGLVLADNLYTETESFEVPAADSLNIYIAFGEHYQTDSATMLNIFGSANIYAEIFEPVNTTYPLVADFGVGGYTMCNPRPETIYKVVLTNYGYSAGSVRLAIVSRPNVQMYFSLPRAYSDFSTQFDGWHHANDATTKIMYFHPPTSGEYMFHFKPDADEYFIPAVYVSDTSSSAAAVVLTGGECFKTTLTAGKEYFVVYHARMYHSNPSVTLTVKQPVSNTTYAGNAALSAPNGSGPSYYVLKFSTAGAKTVTVNHLTRAGYVKVFRDNYYSACYTVTGSSNSFTINTNTGSTYVICVWPANDFTGSPTGNNDTLTGGTGTVTIVGWAFDYDDIFASVNINVYIGGPAGSSDAILYPVTTNVSRSDVNTAYGVYGNHGYNKAITTSKRGIQTVYIYAVNVGPNAANTLITNGYVYIS